MKNMIDQDKLPAHLRDDAPYKECPKCGRKDWGNVHETTACLMPQPDNKPCLGILRAVPRTASNKDCIALGPEAVGTYEPRPTAIESELAQLKAERDELMEALKAMLSDADDGLSFDITKAKARAILSKTK